MSKQTITIGSQIIVGELANKTGISVAETIKELMSSGVMATVNDRIDFADAKKVVESIKPEIELIEGDALPDKPVLKKAKRKIGQEVERPPVIAVMGHVDHGKTTLLDAIRGVSTVDKEAGGITQHIAAYQIEYQGRLMTFLDTPGHEAFISLREHGAHLTDLAIIVVAADDGVKPQTKEAVRFASEAGVKMLVAINKIDKPDANVNRVLQELNDIGLVPEAWGGDTIVVEVSAKNKTGIDKLVEMALLLADVEELKADNIGPAQGIVIESHMQHGRGPMVTVLVEHGQLHRGDFVVAGKTFGKVRTLEDYTGSALDVAGPSTPAIITGLKKLPNFGAVFMAVESEKRARIQAENYRKSHSVTTASHKITGEELLDKIHHDDSAIELAVAIKADVKGSLTSVIDSLMSIGNDEAGVKVVMSGVGNITEGDIKMAAANHATIYGFNVTISINAKRMASSYGVKVKLFKVIYELIDDVKEQLENKLPPEIVEEEQGKLLVKGVFKTSHNDVICGGEVTKGKVTPGLLVRLVRNKTVIGEAEVVSVRKEQHEEKKVSEGDVCGLQLKTKTKLHVKEGDRLEFFSRETRKRNL